MTTAYTVLPHHSETVAKLLQKSRKPKNSSSRQKNHRCISSVTRRTASSYRRTWLPQSDMTRSSAQALLSQTSIHTTQIIGTPPGTITIIQALGATGAGTTLGTMADTAGTTATIPGTITAGTGVGTEASTTHGTTAHGILASTTHTITTCTHTTADGTEVGDLTTAASITDRHTEEDISLSAAERCSEAHEARL